MSYFTYLTVPKTKDNNSDTGLTLAPAQPEDTASLSKLFADSTILEIKNPAFHHSIGGAIQEAAPKLIEAVRKLLSQHRKCGLVISWGTASQCTEPAGKQKIHIDALANVLQTVGDKTFAKTALHAYQIYREKADVKA